MLSLPDIYNWLVTRFVQKSGATMDSAATLTFANEFGAKINLQGAANKAIATNSGDVSIAVGSGGVLRVRESATGTILGDVWHSGNDGSSSGLDADLLDGANSAESGTASTIVKRDSNGDGLFRAVRTTIADQSTSMNSTDAVCFRRNNGADPISRYITRDKLIEWLQAGGLAALTTAHYSGSCSGSGTQTNVTITSVTTTAAYVLPTMGMVEQSQTGVYAAAFTSATNVRLLHNNNYAGPYTFTVVS